MERAKHAELLQTIEKQKEQLTRYETRLRDVVRAYKSLAKEKEALEASIKVLSTTQNTPLNNHGSVRKLESASESERDSEHEEGPAGQINSKSGSLESLDEDPTKLREQVATLSSSLATLTQEKSRMEANFQADKKNIRQVHEEEVAHLNSQTKVQQEKLDELQKQMSEIKSCLRSQQHEREREQNDHQLMLRELQKLLAEERANKELMEQQLDDCRQQLSDRTLSAESEQVFEKQIRELRTELTLARTKLSSAEERASQPSPLLIELQKDMTNAKARHQSSMAQAERRVSEADARVRACRRSCEERVAALEAKISELSALAGELERGRFQDQQALARMRERVSQLDLENTALVHAAHSSTSSDPENDGDNMDVQALVDKIMHLKGQLKSANQHSDKPVNIDELLGGMDSLGLNSDNLHRKCQEDYGQLKEEFERYKLRAQSVLKSKSIKEGGGNKECDQLKQQVLDLRERVRTLRMEQEETEQAAQRREESLRQTLATLEESHAKILQTRESEYKQHMSELEGEIRRHRERTVALLAEKDRELESIRVRTADHYTNYTGLSSPTAQTSVTAPEIGASSVEETAVAELLSRGTGLGSGQMDSTLLHFAQEQARKDIEVAGLRKQKHALEVAYRDCQHKASLQQASLNEQIEFLREEKRKLERNMSREGANLEYLKNVVYRYMVCKDIQSRNAMLNAISTILQFSPKEKNTVKDIINRSWWAK